MEYLAALYMQKLQDYLWSASENARCPYRKDGMGAYCGFVLEQRNAKFLSEVTEDLYITTKPQPYFCRRLR